MSACWYCEGRRPDCLVCDGREDAPIEIVDPPQAPPPEQPYGWAGDESAPTDGRDWDLHHGTWKCNPDRECPARCAGCGHECGRHFVGIGRSDDELLRCGVSDCRCDRFERRCRWCQEVKPLLPASAYCSRACTEEARLVREEDAPR